MSWAPGWDSINDAGWWSNFYFWLGIVCLFLLGASEVISHYYGVRKDELIGTAQAVSDRERADIETIHNQEITAIRGQLDAARNRADEASAKADELRKQRHLTLVEREALVNALKPFQGQKVRIESIMEDGEGRIYAQDFVSVFDEANWDHNGKNGVFRTVYTDDPVGFVVTVSDSYASGANVPEAAKVLIETAVTFKIMDRKTLRTEPKIPDDVIVVRVGKKTLSAGFP